MRRPSQPGGTVGFPAGRASQHASWSKVFKLFLELLDIIVSVKSYRHSSSKQNIIILLKNVKNIVEVLNVKSAVVS